MNGRLFLDTNVLVYADDADAGPRHAAARQLVRSLVGSRQAVLSLQVLHEYFVVATRKLAVPLEIARQKVALLGRLDVVRLDVPDVLAAVDLVRLHQIPYWDALILRAAKIGGCRTVLSEDLQHGRSYDGVAVVDPFR